jgi:hypothetical protein
MTGYRFFFPFRDMPTLIWVKKKEGIFCARGPRRVPPLNTGPIAENLTMTKAFLQPAAKLPGAGTQR